MTVQSLIPTVDDPHDGIIYPESDGKPMADNTKQFRYIIMIENNLALLFRDNADVFVAGDLLWYPVEGRPNISAAPDTMVVFGRPKGDRGSYMQWREDNIAPQVAFEVLSPTNRAGEMKAKRDFYEQYGVQEYYVYDPDRGALEGWMRDGACLRPVDAMEGWRSPLLGITFALDGLDLVLTYPDGRRFLSFLELDAMREAANARAEEASTRAIEAYIRAEKETARADAAEAKLKEMAEKLKQAGLL